MSWALSPPHMVRLWGSEITHHRWKRASETSRTGQRACRRQVTQHHLAQLTPSAGGRFPLSGPVQEGKACLVQGWVYSSPDGTAATLRPHSGCFQRMRKGTSLLVQFLRHCTSIAGVTGLILGQGTKISHAICGQKTEKSKNKK